MVIPGDDFGTRRCECHGSARSADPFFTMECLDCAGGIVHCPRCGQVAWWPARHRERALNACESHRWETGHHRAVLRGFGARFTGGVVTETEGF